MTDSKRTIYTSYTKLDRPKVQQLVEALHDDESSWRRASIADIRNGISWVSDRQGVYFFTLPRQKLPVPRQLTLIGRSATCQGEVRQMHHTYAYDVFPLHPGADEHVLYVGKAYSLSHRVQAHFSTSLSSRRNGVLRGLTGKTHQDLSGDEGRASLRKALDLISEHGRLHYVVLADDDEPETDAWKNSSYSAAATRDLLATTLKALYAPPFNISPDR